jgi:hypothetical protein
MMHEEGAGKAAAEWQPWRNAALSSYILQLANEGGGKLVEGVNVDAVQRWRR